MPSEKNTDHNKQYTADDLEILVLAEAIRKRPAMYIGGTDFFGCINYVVSAFDVLLYNNATWIEIQIDEHIRLKSDAEIPIVINDEGKLEEFEVPKFGKHNPFSPNMLPDGVVLFALSELMEVRINSNLQHCEFRSQKGERTLLRCTPAEVHSTSTDLTLVPDPAIFSVTSVSPAILHSYCRRLACLFPGVKFVIKGLEEATYHTTRGIPDLFDSLSTAYQLLNEPIHIVAEEDHLHLEAVIAFHSWNNNQVWSYVNKGRVPEGGTHEDGLLSGVERFFNRVNRPESPGVFAVLSLQYQQVTFEGCIKNRINNPELFKYVETIIEAELMNWSVTQLQEFKLLSSIERFQFGGMW